MMQRDYVLRMIEQAAAIVRAVLARLMRSGADAQDVRSDLDRAAHLGGFDLELVKLCDVASVLPMLAPAGEPEPGRTWLAAEVLFLDGQTARLRGDPAAAAASFAKARLLFGLLAPSAVLPAGFPHAADRLRDIEMYLHELNMSGDVVDL